MGKVESVRTDQLGLLPWQSSSTNGWSTFYISQTALFISKVSQAYKIYIIWNYIYIKRFLRPRFCSGVWQDFIRWGHHVPWSGSGSCDSDQLGLISVSFDKSWIILIIPHFSFCLFFIIFISIKTKANQSSDFGLSLTPSYAL